MRDPETLDDGFIQRTLLDIQTHFPPRRRLLPPGVGRSSSLAANLSMERRMKRCVRLFNRHHRVRRGSEPVGSPFLSMSKDLLDLTLMTFGDILNMPRAFDMYECVISADWLSHVDLHKDKRYRDHIAHPARVTALAWWLLHRKNKALLREMAAHYRESFRTYDGSISERPERYGWNQLVEYSALLSGLLHDAAYPVEYSLRNGTRMCCPYNSVFWTPTRELFSKVTGRAKILEPLTDSWFLSQAPDLEDRLERLPTGGRERGFKHSHPVIAAVCFGIDGATERNSAQGIVQQMAARAILSHHDDHPFTEVLKDPLATLLLVADRLQSWGRPFVHVSRRDSDSETLEVKPIVECERIVLERRPGDFLARFQMDKTHKELLKKRPYKWNFKDFSDPNKELEWVLRQHPSYPFIKLSARKCIRPRSFLT